jgi:hypothetical protein
MSGFQPPKTIYSVLNEIDDHQLVLPAIQREFVWGEQKICDLFDSLMLGYPIGGFLFWKISDETLKSHTFYGFIKDYDQRPPNNFCPQIGAIATSDNRFAVLDGQQRLTSLNIGLRGSHTVKLPNKRWENPAAFPKRWMYLDLKPTTVDPDDSGSDEESGETESYVFRFKTPVQVENENNTGHMWMKVSDILPLTSVSEVVGYLASSGIGSDRKASNILARLQEVVHTEGTVSHFIELDQDIDRVMNIFIRVNKQGEPLSFADLLLSQATAAWSSGTPDEVVDARQEIRSFTEHLNRPDRRFNFQRDQIMKSCLVLTDRTKLRFKIDSFNRDRMIQIRTAWPDIKSSLDLAVGLLDQFGLTASNLTARSVIHPIAFYIHRRGLDDSYLLSKGFEEDRELVRLWVIRSLLRQGIWGSGLDSLLTRLTKVIEEDGDKGFPYHQILQSMAEIGKSLAFDEDSIQTLLSTGYGDKECFGLLSLIYPSDAKERKHVDHIYPQTAFTKKKLSTLGFSADQQKWMTLAMNELPNLELLTPPENQSKSGKMPLSWLETEYPDSGPRDAIRALHHLGDIMDSLEEFEKFFKERRSNLARVVRDRLGVAQPT